MPIQLEYVPSDTEKALNKEKTDTFSRSLYFARFTNPQLEKKDRQDYFTEGFKTQPSIVRLQSWQRLITSDAFKGEVLYAQLQSRLMVNMAGGVMENAGLCLDRFGMPYIPGSAVKGCARRAALAALREWSEAGGQAEHKPSGTDNPFSSACDVFNTPVEMLAAIARVFGWCEQDWNDKKDVKGRYKSDFAWACGSSQNDFWPALRITTTRQLAPALGIRLTADDPEPWTSLPNFAGSIAFLPAHPVDLGEPGKLELDIVTGHHKDYYSSKDSMAVARDTEEPVPVVFPTVAAGHIFAFAVAKLQTGSASDQAVATAWLTTGLTIFGVGAKTNAGYGWFEDVTEKICSANAARAALLEKEEREARQRAELEAARANLQPDPVLLSKLVGMNEADRRGQFNSFAYPPLDWTQKDERTQLTILHFLMATAPEFLASERSNPKKNIAKAITNLTAKFPSVQP